MWTRLCRFRKADDTYEFTNTYDFLKKKGLASCLLLTCKNCGYSKEFYTSVSNDIPFTLMSELFIA